MMYFLNVYKKIPCSNFNEDLLNFQGKPQYSS